jgi:orotidine-5'-phosphate decarboxylase
LPDEISFYKVGLELFTSDGPHALDFLQQTGRRIFLDLKLHDIPNTVARAVEAASRHHVALLTLHASGGRAMLQAAAAAARACGPIAPKLLAVTTLTSLGESDLKEMGITRPLREHTLALGEMAISAGIDGLVCSPWEAAEFRQRLGEGPILVTPGIRAAGADAGDQKRIATPREAARAGANYLVIGRPILAADDPRAAAIDILNQIK